MKLKILKTLIIALFFTNYTIEANSIKKEKNTIKVALLLDTSNSMDGLINQAKTQLWDIVNELSYAKCQGEIPDLKIALYEYGNDNLSSKKGFIRQVLQFTSDLDEISKQLFSLRTNGGSEFCGQAIASSIKELDWGKNNHDLKMIFIAGNEPFTQGKLHYKDAIANAKENDVSINTIFCGDYSQGVSGMWQDAAYYGNGDYMTINHNKQLVHVKTPYDSEIIILNKKLNSTYIYYGNNGASYAQNQKTQDDNAMELDEEVIVKRAVSKSSRLYDNANWDLVDASKKKNIDYNKIAQQKLPKALQGKSAEDIKTYVEKQKKERVKIQLKINDLNTKRKAHIAKKSISKGKNELDKAMLNAIKKQAQKKNYTW